MKWLEHMQAWFTRRPRLTDAAALVMLTLLWGFYFWRVLTPDPNNQVSLPQGDYSGQFFAFGDYQARRFLAGEIPLWNPYNNAGHPFLADTQSAVFYPPRLFTIVISHWLGGWSYAALEAETIVHVWLASLFMYLFVRTVSRSLTAGLVSGITLAYGGYMAGYPPLQLAVLEAGIWLPLALLGVYKASESEPPAQWQPRWLALSTASLSFSLLAGHPQTSLFLTYVLIAYMIHRAIRRQINWKSTLAVVLGTVGLGFGVAAVQLLPGLEYTRLTTRAGMNFDALAGGFPFSDVLVFLIPNVLTVWSPLYSGIAPLVLASIALWQGRESARFWGGAALIALGISFGGATIFYRLAYLTMPGFALFRGQERAAYVIAYSVAIMAGLGIATLQNSAVKPYRLARILGIGAATAWVLAIEVLILDRVFPDTDLFPFTRAFFFLGLLATLVWIIIGRLSQPAQRVWWSLALIGLLVFDLFSTTMGTNWEPVPASQRRLLSDLVPAALADKGLFRVDGRLGLGENYGTLVGLQDIRGISPLRLTTLDHYLALPQYRLHQLLSVKYVFTDWTQLEVPSSVIAESSDGTLPLYLHQITDPTPRAWMAYRVMVTSDEAQALGWLADPAFDVRGTVILESAPDLDLPSEPPTGWQVQIEQYAPEQIVLSVSTPTDGILVISEMDYPGWQAIVNGEPVPIWRADAGLRALPLRAGEYQIEMVYRPLSVTLGAAGSAVSVLTLLLAVMLSAGKRRS